MKKVIIPQKMSNSGSIHDIASDMMDREIQFRGETKFAVVLASYYGGKGYKTFADKDAAAKAHLKTKESCDLIDSDGNVYDVQDMGWGEYNLTVTHNLKG